MATTWGRSVISDHYLISPKVDSAIPHFTSEKTEAGEYKNSAEVVQQRAELAFPSVCIFTIHHGALREKVPHIEQVPKDSNQRVVRVKTMRVMLAFQLGVSPFNRCRNRDGQMCSLTHEGL